LSAAERLLLAGGLRPAQVAGLAIRMVALSLLRRWADDDSL